MALITKWSLAVTPIVVVLIAMVGFKRGGAQAGFLSWLSALFIAWLAFGAPPTVLVVAQLKSLLLSLYVLYIIWMALLFYHVVNEAGAIATFAAVLPTLTQERGAQVLLLAWAFGSFLQGISGYGVPTAVVAPLLVGLGVSAGTAVIVAGLGHAWAVTFGSLAASFLALVAATGRAGETLATESAVMLGVACFLCGITVLWVAGGAAMAARHWLDLIVTGGVMSGVQFALARLGAYTLASALAGLCGLGVMALLARWRWRSAGRWDSGGGPLPLRWALFPYAALIVIVGMVNLTPSVGDLMDAITIRIQFPAVQTSLGYATPAEVGRTLSVLGHPGALLLYSAAICLAVFRRKGWLGGGAVRKVVGATFRGSIKPTLGIVTMVAMAVTMEHAGMTRALAEGLASAAGSGYPLAAAFIGALGAFMTGSNTNSNVLFAALQDHTATLLGYAPAVALAAQTAGGAIGGAFAPAKVILGCSTVGLGGKEGAVLRGTFAYGIVLVALCGVLALVWLR